MQLKLAKKNKQVSKICWHLPSFQNWEQIVDFLIKHECCWDDHCPPELVLKREDYVLWTKWFVFIEYSWSFGCCCSSSAGLRGGTHDNVCWCCDLYGLISCVADFGPFLCGPGSAFFGEFSNFSSTNLSCLRSVSYALSQEQNGNLIWAWEHLHVKTAVEKIVWLACDGCSVTSCQRLPLYDFHWGNMQWRISLSACPLHFLPALM